MQGLRHKSQISPSCHQSILAHKVPANMQELPHSHSAAAAQRLVAKQQPCGKDRGDAPQHVCVTLIGRIFIFISLGCPSYPDPLSQFVLPSNVHLRRGLRSCSCSWATSAWFGNYSKGSTDRVHAAKVPHSVNAHKRWGATLAGVNRAHEGASMAYLMHAQCVHAGRRLGAAQQRLGCASWRGHAHRPSRSR